MSIYGDLGLNVQTNIVVDKVYSSLGAMNEANIPGEKDDGVFVGRFVQVTEDFSVYRKTGHGTYLLFATYRLPTIELNQQSSKVGKDPTLEYDSDSNHYVLTLPQFVSLSQKEVEFEYNAEGFTKGTKVDKPVNQVELIEDEEEAENVTNYKLKIRVDDIGNAGADLVTSYKAYFTDAGDRSVTQGYKDYLADSGKYSITKGYNDYLDPDQGAIPTGYNQYLDPDQGAIPTGYNQYLDPDQGAIPTNYDIYFGKNEDGENIGKINSFDDWKESQITTEELSLIEDGKELFLQFPTQRTNGRWGYRKLNVQDIIKVSDKKIEAEEKGNSHYTLKISSAVES